MKLLLSASPSEPQFHPDTARRFLEQGPTLILVPTATMADHYRHTLTRSGFALRPQSIQTLAQFLDAHAPMAAAPIPLVHYLLSCALERQKPRQFSSIAQDPGLLGGLTRLFAEASAQRLQHAIAGKASAHHALVISVANLFREVEAELTTRVMAARHARLHAVAKRIEESHGDLPSRLFIDGFAKLSEGEVALILALGDRTQELDTVAVALPTWFGAELARGRLLSAGFEDRATTAPSGRGSVTGMRQTTTFASLNIEREVEEIARRILVHAQQGRPFREMAVILRARDPYGPLVETTLARFGIPSRSYFTDPAARHPAIQYLSTVMQSLLANWDLDSLLSGLRMPVSGLGTTEKGDEFDFALRERLPGKGLPSGEDYFSQHHLKHHRRKRGQKPSERFLTKDASVPHEILQQLEPLTALRTERMEPAAWAGRLLTLTALIPSPVVADDATLDQVQMWRSTAVALQSFKDALQSSAEALGSSHGRCDLKAFWNQVSTTLSLEPLRVLDLRRNVVHVMDAYEARQWELPIVFVCGMTERHFPQYHSENPIIGDDVLRRAGLDTAADHEREEQYLFDVATTRATVETVLSYPKFNEAGDPTLPSFFLQGATNATEDCAIQVRPGFKATASKVDSLQPRIADPSLRQKLATAHKTLSATSIERFLQCPFQFFAEKTLRLRERPPAPRDRLDILLQGSILHRALAEWSERPLLGSAILDQIFNDECAQAQVPDGYRTEAVRLELRRHFQAFLEDDSMPGYPSRRVELFFEMPLTDALSIRGIIDRVDINAAIASERTPALVIDYKYSAGSKIRERIEESADGNMVQAGLYMLAAREAFGLDPIGMLFCGLKKGVTWDGWHLDAPGIEAGGKCTPDVLEGMMLQAREQALVVHQGVLSGRIAPEPTDKIKCRWCDLKDICRIETSQSRERLVAIHGDAR
ncbi:MAG: PD-(D/E)XK nuclease family protein [Acidobacteriota bacterium]